MNSIKKKKILIIDDAADIRALLRSVLEANDYEVDSTANGEEALSLLSELQILPDLILLDSQMPIMDGCQFRQEQKQWGRISQIPVIVTSGDGDLDLSLKMDFPLKILCKPVGMELVLKSISDCLESKTA